MITSNLRHLPALVLNMPKTLSNLQQPGRWEVSAGHPLGAGHPLASLAMACRPGINQAQQRLRRGGCSAGLCLCLTLQKPEPEARHLPSSLLKLHECNLDSVWTQHKATLQLTAENTGGHDACSIVLVLDDAKEPWGPIRQHGAGE